MNMNYKLHSKVPELMIMIDYDDDFCRALRVFENLKLFIIGN